MPTDHWIIARSVSMRQILTTFSVRIRNSKRADCPLCKGHSNGTIAFTHLLWRCHRCNEGGDVFSFVRAVNHCDFPKALRFIANVAGIRLEGRWSSDFRRELDERRRQQERLEDGATTLLALEHALLCECRDRIHNAERIKTEVGERLSALWHGEPERFRGEQEGLWLKLQAAAALLSADILAYTMLTFGAFDERAQFVLHPELRDEMIAAIRWAGHIRTVDGKQIEVLT